MRGYPVWFSARLISLTVTSLFFSGCLLIPTMLDLRLQWEVPWRLPDTARLLVTAIHSFIGMLVIWLTGALWSVHMRMEWRRKMNRTSGISTIACIGFLMLSGLGIYYFGNPDLSLTSSLSHSLIGIFLFFAYCLHANSSQKT